MPAGDNQGPVYAARISLNPLPGMTVTVDIRIGERGIIIRHGRA